MNNRDIHKGLPNSEIRDFITKSFNQIFIDECSNVEQKFCYDRNDVTDWAIKLAEEKVRYFTRQIEILKHKRALVEILKLSGWEEFDVSDETLKHPNDRNHMAFIGTKEEFTNLKLK